MIEVFVRIAEIEVVQMAISFGCADIVDTPKKRVFQESLSFHVHLGDVDVRWRKLGREDSDLFLLPGRRRLLISRLLPTKNPTEEGILPLQLPPTLDAAADPRLRFYPLAPITHQPIITRQDSSQALFSFSSSDFVRAISLLL